MPMKLGILSLLTNMLLTNQADQYKGMGKNCPTIDFMVACFFMMLLLDFLVQNIRCLCGCSRINKLSKKYHFPSMQFFSCMRCAPHNQRSTEKAIESNKCLNFCSDVPLCMQQFIMIQSHFFEPIRPFGVVSEMHQQLETFLKFC